MTVNLEKTNFLQKEIRFLGLIFSANGVFTDTDLDKVKSIVDFPVPKSQKDLRAFLGLCGYYRRFFNQYSHCIAFLTQLLKKGIAWKWTLEHQECLEKTKSLFLDTVILHFSDFTCTFYLQIDGSGVALGVEVCQVFDNGEHVVIGFASGVLRSPETFYTVMEKEVFAITFGLQKFCTILLGHKIGIRTDHFVFEFLKQCRLLNDRLTS